MCFRWWHFKSIASIGCNEADRQFGWGALKQISCHSFSLRKLLCVSFSFHTLFHCMLLPFHDDFHTNLKTTIKHSSNLLWKYFRQTKKWNGHSFFLYYLFRLYVLLDFRHPEMALFLSANTITQWDFATRQDASKANQMPNSFRIVFYGSIFPSSFWYQRFDVIPWNRLCEPCVTNKHRTITKYVYTIVILLCLIVSTRIWWASKAKICYKETRRNEWGTKKKRIERKWHLQKRSKKIYILSRLLWWFLGRVPK